MTPAAPGRRSPLGEIADRDNPAHRIVLEYDEDTQALRVRIATRGKRGALCTLDGEGIAWLCLRMAYANLWCAVPWKGPPEAQVGGEP